MTPLTCWSSRCTSLRSSPSLCFRGPHAASSTESPRPVLCTTTPAGLLMK
eukprot:CAMPEP_0202912682 /NCGR_PEP_ID=MMETSP1392-20130828/58426_1 /ASSEMBLY_ACC=CAM_ASM_000868 /TAXON_ID=225041 /ORGANISM="Chlamydomonas chlamydogama, Strain SAG 11-48b" /LENGTH=49 /DNA_ID= /DNA_START= /DNA_END= /DNA_ORIENTATION=